MSRLRDPQRRCLGPARPRPSSTPAPPHSPDMAAAGQAALKMAAAPQPRRHAQHGRRWTAADGQSACEERAGGGPRPSRVGGAGRTVGCAAGLLPRPLREAAPVGADGVKQSAITALPTPPSANRGPASSEGGLSKELPVPPGGRNAGAGVAGTRAGERFEGRTRLRPGRGDERGLGEGSGGSRPALGTLGWVAGEDGRVGG